METWEQSITQLDPIKWNLPYYRFLNEDRIELPDIDVDLDPVRRPAIIQKIKQERGANFKPEIDEISRKNLGCTMIATFGTLKTKNAILTSCRGYRSEEYPDGIDNDTADFLSSLVPQERGFLWSLDEVVNGNPEKGRKPSQTFIKEVKKYPGLLDIMFALEGLVSQIGSHASGFMFLDEDPYERACYMTTPGGDVITQWDLHESEWAGLTKYDLK